MKKTYISPSFIMVRLNLSTSVLTTSTFGMNGDDGNQLDSGEILVKENTIRDVNLWDNEW